MVDEDGTDPTLRGTVVALVVRQRSLIHLEATWALIPTSASPDLFSHVGITFFLSQKSGPQPGGAYGPRRIRD